MSTPYAENFDKAYGNACMRLEETLLGWTMREIRSFGSCKVHFMSYADEVIDLAVTNRVDFQCEKPKPITLPEGVTMPDDRPIPNPDALIAMRQLGAYYSLLYIKLKTAWHQAYDGNQNYSKREAA